MNIVVFNNGVVHAKSRTLSFSNYFDTVHYIDLAGVDDPKYFDGSNIIYYKPFPGKRNLLSDFKMIELLKNLKPDVIVSHYAAGSGTYNSISYGKCPVSVIAMGHDVLYDKGDGHKPNYEKFLTRYALKKTDYISAKSSILKKRLLSYGVRSKIDVNYWGTDFNTFRSVPKEKAKLELGLSDIRSILLSPRAIEPRLNILLIVEAFNEIKNQFPGLHLIIVGRALESYKKTVVEFIEKNNLNDRVKIFDQCSAERLNLLYNAADVVVSMGSSEGFPNSVLEAMACKRPVLIGKIDQIYDLLDSDNSVICAIEKTDITNSLKKIFNNLDYYDKTITEAAFKTVSNFGNLQTNGQNYAVELKQVITNYRNLPGYIKVINTIRKKTFGIVYLLIMIFRKTIFIKK